MCERERDGWRERVTQRETERERERLTDSRRGQGHQLKESLKTERALNLSSDPPPPLSASSMLGTERKMDKVTGCKRQSDKEGGQRRKPEGFLEGTHLLFVHVLQQFVNLEQSQ